MAQFLHKHIRLILLLSFFCALYCLISLVNHYNFRTYGFDLGIYNNVLFDYSQFELNDNPVMHREFDNILSDHLSLYHFVFAPFRYLFGSWTLLLFQIASILFGAIGIHKLILFLSESKKTALISTFHFLSMWGIFSALSFDYHDNVVATMFIPWLFLSVLQKNIRVTIIWSVIICISKENISLWLAFIFLGIGIWKYKDVRIRKISAWGTIGALLYFIIAIKVVMPAMVNEGTSYGHLKYSVLGNNMGEYIETLVLRPKYAFSLLFENHLDNTVYNGIKTEFFFVLLLSGGVALLYKPQFILMLIPIFIQKLYNDDYAKWGINNHYSVEFAPILTIVFAVWIIDVVRTKKYRQVFIMTGAILCFIVNLSVIDSRTSKWYNSKALRFWDSGHYSRSFNVAQVHDYLETIPSDAKVCAQNMLVPHLAFREDIYTFPYIRDAEYIALLPGAYAPYPLKKQSYNKKIEDLRNNAQYNTVIDTKDFILFEKQ
ncbi:MAG: DUF2079 domain-containing protein [Bacteroidales bacterium]